MIFTSLGYFAFFLVVLVFLALVKNCRAQKVGLLIASYYFYTRWNWHFVGLLVGLTGSTYFCCHMMEHAGQVRQKKLWLTAAIVIALGTLGWFKYANFFLSSVNQLGLQLGLLDVILPVGISFIVFEVISYAVDVYRGDAPFERDLLDFALLVAFFPHLISGPILKPKSFLPQLKVSTRITIPNLSAGAQLFVWGMVKKLLVSDRVAVLVNTVFGHSSSFGTGLTWLAVIGYAVQIYGDFSGYTDMAIGSARCMGYDIHRNFELPYLARNLTDFWRRWHISLSSWLRDYLYIPLGGNRKGKMRTYVNLAIVMLLGGLWHGASWNFVLWGGFHGGGLAFHKLLNDAKAWPKLPDRIARTVSWAITLVFVCTAWVPFRSTNWTDTVTILRHMYLPSGDSGVHWVSISLLYALPCLFLADYLSYQWHNGNRLHLSRFRHQLAFSMIVLGILVLAPPASSPFIYFQF